MYYTTESIKASRKKDMNRNYLTLDDKKYVIKVTNYECLFQLEFYMSKSGVKGYEYSDEKTAKSLDMTVRKVADNRRKLEKAGLYRTEIYGSGSNKAVITYIGDSLQQHRCGKNEPLLQSAS